MTLPSKVNDYVVQLDCRNFVTFKVYILYNCNNWSLKKCAILKKMPKYRVTDIIGKSLMRDLNSNLSDFIYFL